MNVGEGRKWIDDCTGKGGLSAGHVWRQRYMGRLAKVTEQIDCTSEKRGRGAQLWDEEVEGLA